MGALFGLLPELMIPKQLLLLISNKSLFASHFERPFAFRLTLGPPIITHEIARGEPGLPVPLSQGRQAPRAACCYVVGQAG